MAQENYLDFRDQGLHGVRGSAHILAMIEPHRHPIWRLDVSHNRLNTDGCIHLFKGLKAIRERRNLESNDDKGFTLEVIMLAGNWIEDPALPVIAAYLDGDTTLRELVLSNNGIEGVNHMSALGRAIASSQMQSLVVLNNPLRHHALRDFLEGLAPKCTTHPARYRLSDLDWAYSIPNEDTVTALGDFLADSRRSHHIGSLNLYDDDGLGDLSSAGFALLWVAIHRYNRNLREVLLPRFNQHIGENRKNDDATRANIMKASTHYAEMGLPLPRTPRDSQGFTLEEHEFGRERSILIRTMENRKLLRSLTTSFAQLLPASRIVLNGFKDEAFRGRFHILDLPPELLTMIVKNIAVDPDIPSARQWNDLMAYATDRAAVSSATGSETREDVMFKLGWDCYDA
ncbi:hypothetical protein FFLO_01323 [Filobasidium floriforme]|uniref:Uncharacterized protein n=1 Tax=Filobasidium floriforme TaxID=5210 RepID=A0A8K0JRP1_9TREE|nr:hypothetical protein FFLO_01323 [Filobasidium floriforme]